jgi:hypothetical protein
MGIRSYSREIWREGRRSDNRTSGLRRGRIGRGAASRWRVAEEVSTSRAIADAREDVVAIDKLTGAIMSNVGTFRIDIEVETRRGPANGGVSSVCWSW